jgi:hypothetical protein
MSRERHINLFAHASSPEEVYAALQRDFRRDSRLLLVCLALFGFAAYGTVHWSGHPEWGWLLSAGFSLFAALALFLDNSNRNWAMHVIDWVEHRHRNGAT